MAKTAKKKVEEYVENIVSMNLEKIVGDRFGKYSKYIIQERALPDVRDGLKPVQRRILFAMHELGMSSTKSYKKSARIVGDVIGKYHPHGDSAAYDAMVRMSQSWKTNNVLVDMHGNNGSIDNDPAAAMRYTEARPSVFAELLLKDIDKKTVTFVPNYDDAEWEPVVLPARFPNLLVNGSQGMATGYATNIPPHNLSEVISATIYRTKHPLCGIDDILTFIKGPDFPTGGIVEGKEGIRKAFLTGKGKVIIKSKVRVEDTALIIDEIPFEVNKADLVKKIEDIRLKKKIDGILEVKDMSDRLGLSIIIKLKKEISSDVILAYLYKNTDLQISYNYNMVVISQRSPKQLGIINIIDEFIQHQKEVIRNRSNYLLRKAETRKHIVLGFLNMVDVLDEVIQIIRKSLGKKDAINHLVEKFNFTENQADAIVSLQLYRLSTTDVKQMRKEATELARNIKGLQRILTNEGALEEVIINELKEILNTYPEERKSIIKDEIQKIEIDELELIQNEEVRFIISKDGYIKRSSLKSYQATPGNTGLKENDLVLKECTLNTRNNIIFFTNLGNFILLPVYKVPDMKWRETGEYISNFAPLLPDEKVIDLIVTNNFNNCHKVLLANYEGKIKQVEINDFQKNRINRTYNCMSASKINPLVSVDILESYDRDIVLATKSGYILKYSIDEVPTQTLSAKGVKGINLRDDALIGAKYTSNINKDEIMLLTNRGGLIREFSSNIALGKRPAKGKLRLKKVKTNPYQFVSLISTNIFRLKELISIRVIGELDEVVIKGTDILPDRYEYGIPVLPKSKKPALLSIDLDNPKEATMLLEKLAVNLVEDETPEEDTKDMLAELEKIISSSKPATKIKSKNTSKRLTDEDEELDDKVIQQTLF